MSDNLGLARPALALRLEQARRWRNRDRLPAEEYLARHPELNANPEYGLEVVYGELLLREEEGETPGIEEFLRRFPQFASQLQRLFDIHSVVRSACLAEARAAETLREGGQPDAGGAAAISPPALPGYEILAELGRGSMGVVYKALHLRLNRVVALKVVQDGCCLHPENLVRFLSETEAVAGVQHPHIAQIYEVGQINDRPYYTMEFVGGGTLAQKIARAPQPPRQAAHVVEMLARAVHAMHHCGIVHRDLKPANVLLAADGTPRITDFGLAKRMGGDSGLTQTGEILGTPSYMAPEQADGRIKDLGPLTDVYALGAILYEMLTGSPPFVGVTVLDVLDQVKNKEPLPFTRLRIHVPRDLETICMKCLQKEPTQRYASAEDLAEDLRRFLDGRPIVARPIGVLASVWLWAHRPERVPGAGVFSVAFGIVLILWSALGVVLVASNIHHTETPRQAILYMGGLMGFVYLPLILSGVGTIARKLISLWLGIGISLFGVIFSLGMIFKDILGFKFDLGGLQNSFEIRSTTYLLVGIISLFGLLMHTAALVACYANRELMRGAPVDAGSLPKLGGEGKAGKPSPADRA
jgi:serine/threonine-protein kinase